MLEREDEVGVVDRGHHSQGGQGCTWPSRQTHLLGLCGPGKVGFGHTCQLWGLRSAAGTPGAMLEAL